MPLAVTTGQALDVVLAVFLVVVGLAIPPRRPADAFEPHEAGDVREVVSSGV